MCRVNSQRGRVRPETDRKERRRRSEPPESNRKSRVSSEGGRDIDPTLEHGRRDLEGKRRNTFNTYTLRIRDRTADLRFEVLPSLDVNMRVMDEVRLCVKILFTNVFVFVNLLSVSLHTHTHM